MTTHPTGAVSRRAAYDLVARYLAAVPPDAGGDDARLWRAVDLALDASGLPPMTAPALTAPPAPPAPPPVLLVQPAGGHLDDGEAPDWRALVLEHGHDDARWVVLGRFTAGGTVTGLPGSWREHVAWMREHNLEVDARAGRAFTADELALLADDNVPNHAAAAILGRDLVPVAKKRQRLRSGGH